MKQFLGIFLFLLFFGTLTAQEIELSSETNTNADSLIVKEDPYGVFDMFQGNPGKAALYSLIIPSSGQLYNKHYWKVPLVLGAEGLAIYNLVNEWREFNQWDEDWKALLNDEVPPNNEVASLTDAFRERQNQKVDRNQAWLILIGVHIVSIADAFVSRHLIEFDVDDDISFEFKPLLPYPGLNLTMNF